LLSDLTWEQGGSSHIFKFTAQNLQREVGEKIYANAEEHDDTESKYINNNGLYNIPSAVRFTE
jgi:hypothetical protein